MRPYFVLAFAFCSLSAHGQDDYYRNFTSLAGTYLRIHALESPSVVDTNNIGAKMTNGVLNLQNVLETGEISGLHLGMTMSETVAIWGKPRAAYNRCVRGLPSLFYKDVSLAFDTDSLDTLQFRPDVKIISGLSSQSAPQDFVRVLGTATRHSEEDGDTRSLDYVGPKASLRLFFWDRRLNYIWIVQSAKSLEPRKFKEGSASP